MSLLRERQLSGEPQLPQPRRHVWIGRIDPEVVVVDDRHLVRVENREAFQLVGREQLIGGGKLIFFEDDRRRRGNDGRGQTGIERFQREAARGVDGSPVVLTENVRGVAKVDENQPDAAAPARSLRSSNSS